MARDRRREADRRNAKARAEGWESYGQKYRAEKANYSTPEEYRAAVDANRQRRGAAKRAAAGRLLAVVGANWPDGAHDQWQAIRRYGAKRHVRLMIETTDGVINRSRHGGYRMGWIKSEIKRLVADGRSSGEAWQEVVESIAADAFAEEYRGRDISPEDRPSWIDLVTATVV